MSHAKLLIEELQPVEANMIMESSQDGKSLWLNGICMQSEIDNRNRRRYPLSEIQRAVQLAQSRIAECNGIFGELDHPQTLQINLDRVSHVITEMWMVGNNAYGKAKIIDKAPMGQIARALVESGVKIGVSSRGAGNVNESGHVSDFNFITYDIVCTPSAMGAIPNSMYESLDNSRGKKILTLAEEVIHDKDAQKYFKAEIMRWLNTGIFQKK